MSRRSSMRRERISLVAALVVASAWAWACVDVTDVELLEIDGSGVLFGQVFLDLDGNGGLSGADEPMADVGVLLVTSGTSDVVDSTTTDSLGVFVFAEAPLGSYLIDLPASVLGDSLNTLGGDQAVTIAYGDTLQFILGATYQTLSLQEALAAPVGRRVFTSGIALNQRVNFGSGQIHFKEPGTYLRALNVERGSLNPGDSARLLGRVIEDNGRPALDDVTFAVLVSGAQFVTPEEVTTGIAATADGTQLDAALVRIRNAEITDTSTFNGHFRFWADDGTDSVEFVIRDFLVPTIDKTQFRPDTIVRIQRATGLLSPLDDAPNPLRWRFLLRSGNDFALETKRADVSVQTSFDAGSATTGDTVEISVIASNAGPVAATSLQVRDTIPTGATYVASTVTTGSYDDATGIWDLGTLAVGAADTLVVRVEVTAAGGGAILNIAGHLGLVMEVDPVAGNNAASAVLPIS